MGEGISAEIRNLTDSGDDGDSAFLAGLLDVNMPPDM